MIRETRAEDKFGVVDLIREFYLEELNKYGYKFSYEKACQDFDTAFKLPFIYSLVIDNINIDGSLDGFIGCFICKRMFLAGVTAQELMWYVKKEKRRQGIRLLQEFERGCKARGCNDIMMIGLEGSKACKVYESLGYRKQETMYFKEV